VRYQGSESFALGFKGRDFRRHEISASISSDSSARHSRRLRLLSIRGSGIVHTAPGHGADDFNSGQKYGLEIYAPLDDKGVYLEGLPEYKGKDVFTANPIIVKLLGDRGALLGHHEYKHSYPHCWRCHNPVIFRATEQWFIKMDPGGPRKRKKSLRQEALEEVHGVKWIPRLGRRSHVRND